MRNCRLVLRHMSSKLDKSSLLQAPLAGLATGTEQGKVNLRRVTPLILLWKVRNVLWSDGQLGRGRLSQGVSSQPRALHQPSSGFMSSWMIPRNSSSCLGSGVSPQAELGSGPLPHASFGAWLSPGPGCQAGMWVSRFFPRCFSGIPDRAHQSCLLSALHALVSLS